MGSELLNKHPLHIGKGCRTNDTLVSAVTNNIQQNEKKVNVFMARSQGQLEILHNKGVN